jgi:hypothetical protein
MRWLPKAIPALIAIIALDFALVFGFEAFRVLSSPVYGLDQLAFANLVHGIGRLFGITGQGLFSLAAFFGGIYLTVSAVFMLHLASRAGALRGGRVWHDLLDAALILVVLVTIVAATPAILKGATDILVQERLPLWLVGLAATLSMIERLPETETVQPTFVERLWVRFAARRKRADSAVVTPALRGKETADRWDDLRTEGGLVIEPVPVARPIGPWFPLRPH